MENFDDLKHAVQEGMLVDYILGKGNFSYDRPEEGYARWSRLARLHDTLDAQNPLRTTIEETVDSLFDREEATAQYASIALGRVLGTPTIVKRIVDVIKNSRIDSYDHGVQEEILFSSLKLRISEVARTVVERFVDQNRVPEYLLASATPPYIPQVGADDLWRLDTLGRCYEDSSVERRSIILDQIATTARNQKNVQLVLSKYVSSRPDLPNYAMALIGVLLSLGVAV